MRRTEHRAVLLLAFTVGLVAAQGGQQPQASAPAETLSVPMDQHSFKAPFSNVNSFTGMRLIDNWELGGSAVAHNGFVRLTAEKQSQKGWIWNRHPLTATDWSLTMELRATGESQYLFGDGVAIWLTSRYDVIEGPVFGREDYWKGLGIFFDTFQNVDQQHHHKHPYIYAMLNDGTKHYVPDAEKKLNKAQQILPGAKDNSGCSYDFRYNEARQDVSVLNHTRVHVTYHRRKLKLRLQQTSVGHQGDWYNCFEMSDVDIPAGSYFAISSATGDLVDNHDIMHFQTSNLEGVSDPILDFKNWFDRAQEMERSLLVDFEVRPSEVLQRDYQRVVRAQAEAIKTLSADVVKLKAQMEFQLASITAGVSVARSSVDNKANELREVKERLEKTGATHAVISDLKRDAQQELMAIKKSVDKAIRHGGMSNFYFYFLLLLIVALGGVGYNRYRKIMKSHLL
jgi:hypothetical protein